MAFMFHRCSALALALAAATGLGACGRDEGRGDARTDSRPGVPEVNANAEAAGSKTRDMAITAEVRTRLASDADLGALAINVDTKDGRVVLRGTAHDTSARTHATELARTVDGVVDVNNALTVQLRSN